MIKGKFLAKVATAGVLASLIAAPAFAGECTAVDKAKIEARKEFSGITVIDFRKSSEACLEKYATSFSRRNLVHVTLDDSNEWHSINVDAAKKHISNGRPSVVFLGHQSEDGKAAEVAITHLWQGGFMSEPAAFSLAEGGAINALASNAPNIQEIRETAVNKVYTKGLVALNLPEDNTVADTGNTVASLTGYQGQSGDATIAANTSSLLQRVP